MTREPHKRTRRILFSSEELSHMMAYRKHREQVTLLKFKRSKTYKALNIFNVCCIFIYLEILFCFFGPCNYSHHYSANTVSRYGYTYKKDGTRILADVDVYGVNGRVYQFVVDEFADVPPKFQRFTIGKDYLFRKDLKGRLQGDPAFYRLFSASPILFLCMFISFISFMAFVFNLNESFYPLCGLSFINLVTLFGILVM